MYEIVVMRHKKKPTIIFYMLFMESGAKINIGGNYGTHRTLGELIRDLYNTKSSDLLKNQTKSNILAYNDHCEVVETIELESIKKEYLEKEFPHFLIL